VAGSRNAYVPLSSTTNFVSVFISWLNLDIGFDVCAYEGMTIAHKAVLQLAFPAYVVFLVVVVIIIGEYSSKFATVVGKGNPVAVLATMILISFTK
jgi:transcription initiation factor TFIID subunit 2/histone acetyltransferase MYST3